MPELLRRLQGLCAATTAAAITLGASPVSASTAAGLGGFQGPITAWLARAPANCVVTSYFKKTITGLHPPDSNHVAYSIGRAMGPDPIEKLFSGAPDWHGDIGDGDEEVSALDDPRRHVAAFALVGFGAGTAGAMEEYGAFAQMPDPPASAPPMRADLSKIALGGNVHLGDSLAAVRSALGLRALVPTAIPVCPGFGIVEVCDQNVFACACTDGAEPESGTIIFYDRRVIGLVWDNKCFIPG